MGDLWEPGHMDTVTIKGSGGGGLVLLLPLLVFLLIVMAHG